MNQDRVMQGICDMIGHLIYDAANPPKLNKRKTNKYDIERLKKINIRWAKESKLLTHYCDVMGMDRKRIESKIIELNSTRADRPCHSQRAGRPAKNKRADAGT